MKKLLVVLLAVFISVQSMGSAAQVDEINLYAAPNGSDTYGNGSFMNPYKTVERVSEAAKLIMKSGTQKNINVIFREGEYVLEKTITIDGVSKGAYKGKLTYKAYQNENVCFLGAKKGHTWEKYKDGIYRISSEKRINSVYESGTMSIKARYPNRGELRSDGYLTAAYGGDSKTIVFNDGDIPNVSNQADLQVYAFAGGEQCVYSLDNIGASIDYNSNSITTVRSSTNNVAFREGSRYYLQNAIEFLDESGELYYNSNEKMLYYKPYNEKNLSEIYIPDLTAAIAVTGKYASVSNVEIRGIEFRYFDTAFSGTSKVISSEYADNIGIYDCKISNCGGMGIGISYTDNSVICGNKIENIGAGGIRINYSQSADNKGNNLICDNYIKNIGLNIADVSGIVLQSTSSNTVEHNTISYVPRAAIGIGGPGSQTWEKLGTEINGVVIDRDNVKSYLLSNDNKVQYNDLSHAMLETNDGAVIYTSTVGYDNDISYNYIHDSTAEFSHNFGGIYLDDDTHRTTVTNNFITRLYSDGGDMMNILLIKGQNNLFENNIITNCTVKKGVTRVDSQSGCGPVGNVTFRKNIIYNCGNHMYDFYSIEQTPKNPENIKFKECNNNIYYDFNGDYDVLVRESETQVKRLEDIHGWQKVYGWDFDSKFVKPEFADTYSRDFRLMADGEAARLGINGIDISGCGVADAYKYDSDDDIKNLYIVPENIQKAEAVLNVEDTIKLNTLVRDENGIVVKDAKINFYTSDSKVCTISIDGTVKSIGSGNAVITAVAQKNGKLVTAEFYIKVLIKN